MPIILADFLHLRQNKRQSLTLVTGVFDLLHEEHYSFLLKAKGLADLLLVGLESDQRVRAMKGEGRPVNNAVRRLANLSKWDLADFIFILPDDFASREAHRQLIEQIRPDFLAVSAHTLFKKEKQAILDEFGAKLVEVHDFNPEFSSTKILANLKKKGAL